MIIVTGLLLLKNLKNFAARLKQSKLLSKNEYRFYMLVLSKKTPHFNNKLKILNKKFISIKTKHIKLKDDLEKGLK